jgi:8-oxo-dGTP pyrophosphatase MutT (NUDIX family)
MKLTLALESEGPDVFWHGRACYTSRVVSALDEATLREPLRRALSSREPRRLPVGATTAAAVLLSLFEKDGETHLWLVRRPKSMRSHGGQVAFPGGKSDPADDSVMATALREAHEELGIARASVDVLGSLDDYVTITGFTISPCVGWLAPDVEVRPNPSEVERAFAVPIRSFLEPATGILPWRGWKVDGELVWGATAAIVRGFASIVRALSADQ